MATGKDNKTVAGSTTRSSSSDMLPPLNVSSCPDRLGFAFSTRKKWWIVTVVAMIQISMNMNASIYGNAVGLMTRDKGGPNGMVRAGFSVFLIAYAFGCELWAPWSEESGRWKTLQWSLGLVNLWQIPPTILLFMPMPFSGRHVVTIVLISRLMGGLCSAGGSVTLGMVADMWHAEEQEHAMAYVVFASVTGSIVGPVVGGFLQSFASGYWVFPTQLILGLVVQVIHFFGVPETRSTVIVTRYAKEQRKLEGDSPTTWSKYELEKTDILSRHGLSYACKIWRRPFAMLATEPIVLLLSLISGFSDALIFSFLESLPMVMGQWGLTAWQMGLCFVPIFIGYILGYGIWIYFIRRRRALTIAQDSFLPPESRLVWLLWTAPLLPLAIFPFAWTGSGPPMHFMVPLVFLVFIGIANYAIYGATVDYMVATYGEKYAASATGGNGFSRDILAGLSAFYTKALYSNIGPRGKTLQYGSTLLGCLAIPLIVPIYVFWSKGVGIRRSSKRAQDIEHERAEDPTIPHHPKEASATQSTA